MNKITANALVLRTFESAIVRFNSRIKKGLSLECWPWIGGTSSSGYGVHYIQGRPIPAHRFAWILAGRRLDITRELDHLCRNRVCVNPAHLDQVTTKTNILRGNGASAQNARKTHCPKGHPYNEENTLNLRGKRGGRKCRTCDRVRKREAWKSLSQAALKPQGA